MIGAPCRPPFFLAFPTTGAVIVAAMAASAASDGAGSVVYGRQLAVEVCGECHRVSRERDPRPPMQEDLAAPDLTERVRDPAITEMALRSYLRTSHPIMPNIRLTGEQTDDIVAYLMSLKGSAR